MTLKKLEELRSRFFLGVAVFAGLLVFTQKAIFAVLLVLLVAGWLVLTALFWRCPHCQQFLGRSRGEYCPHCGEKLEEEGDGQ